MGDDTWLQIFPNNMNESYPFSSFNVRDLNTVDRGCMTHLYPSIEKNESDLIISHFLGVDHVGHRFEANHEKMRNKLTELNEMLSKTVNLINNDTLLLMFGDHGMTDEGDHGGESKKEIEAALFVYTKKSLFDENSYPLYRNVY